jgi:GWxTD domain-containing protein
VSFLYKTYRIFSGKVLLYLVIPVTLFLFYGCSGSRQYVSTRWNLSSIYNPASSRIHPALKVYHNADLTSMLYIKVFPMELLFSQAGADGDMISKVSFHLELYEINEDVNVMVDSSTYEYTVKKESIENRFITQISIPAEYGKTYYLKVITKDLMRKSFNVSFLYIDKMNIYSEQNFNFISYDAIPLFTPVLNSESFFRIQYRDPSYNKLYISYYTDKSDLPKPTFAATSTEFVYHKPDSTWEVDFQRNMVMKFTLPGMYHFRIDTNRPEGLTLFNFGKDFPRVKTPQLLIDALAYITTSAEYNRLKSEDNLKLAADNYWLKLGGSTSRARELIRIYYNRVYFANYYFTSDKPGWKTDRGMVYIVYGPPHNLKKETSGETWIYYRKGASSSITFKFDYVPSNFTLNKYVLERSESHDWHWREAVDAWREGKIYLLD